MPACPSMALERASQRCWGRPALRPLPHRCVRDPAHGDGHVTARPASTLAVGRQAASMPGRRASAEKHDRRVVDGLGEWQKSIGCVQARLGSIIAPPALHDPARLRGQGLSEIDQSGGAPKDQGRWAFRRPRPAAVEESACWRFDFGPVIGRHPRMIAPFELRFSRRVGERPRPGAPWHWWWLSPCPDAAAGSGRSMRQRTDGARFVC
jgi:hypothetical protein